MKWKSAIGLMALAFGFGGSCLAAKAQTAVVIHAGQLFDGKSDRLASKQVIVIQGDRIAELGLEGSVKIPTGAEEIDLGTATVLPGLIEGHVWTAPAVQEESDFLRSVRVQPCIRPCMGLLLSSGEDEVTVINLKIFDHTGTAVGMATRSAQEE